MTARDQHARTRGVCAACTVVAPPASSCAPGAGKRIAVTRVDGSAAANKALRTVLFGVSQKGAVYPQLFACRSTTCEGAAGAAHATVDPAAVTFLGDGEALIDAVEREAVDELLVPLSRQG